VVRLSALGADSLYSPGNIPGTHFRYTLNQPHCHSANGRIISMKNSNETIGNRTRDLSPCSAMIQDIMSSISPAEFRWAVKCAFFLYEVCLRAEKMITSSSFDLLKSVGYFIYHQVWHSKFLRGAELRLSVLCGLVPCTTLTVRFCITEMESVYCAVRTESLYTTEKFRP